MQSQARPKSSSGTFTIAIPLLHQNQQKIKQEANRFNVICCGRRFGKDILCIELAIEPAVAGFPVGWFQPTYKSLLEVWRYMKRVLRPIATSISEQDKRIELVTGGIIDFWSLDSDPEACRGRKYKRVIINEAAKVRHLELAWKQAILPTLMDYEGDAFFPSTPRGRDFYKELFDRGATPASREEWGKWMSWQMPTAANPYIRPSEIENQRKELPSDVFGQEVLAEFRDVAGKFFWEWEPSRKWTDFDEKTGKSLERTRSWHVCDPFQIPDHWPMWFAVDYGTSPQSPTFAVLLAAVDERGIVYVVDEIYEAGKQAPEQAQLILEMLERHGLAWPADPNNRDGLWLLSPRLGLSPMDYAGTFPPVDVKQRAVGKYPVEHYWGRGLKNVVAAIKNRRAMWQEVNMRLHQFTTILLKDGSEWALPMLRVFKGRCPNLIRTMPLMERSELDPEDIRGGNHRGGENKQEDHLPTCLGYGSRRGVVPAIDPATIPKPVEKFPFADQSKLPEALRSNREPVVYE